MTSYQCEHCDKEIIDTPKGRINGCDHYPLELPAEVSIYMPEPVENPVTKFLGVPSKQKDLTPTERFRNESTYHGRRNIPKPNYPAGEHYNQEEENDMDTDAMTAAPVYDTEWDR